MKKVQIEMSIIDNLGDETVISQIGNYEEPGKITFNDQDVLVKVTMNNIIVIERECKEYEIKLIFDENNITKSTYIIYNPNMVLEMKVKTLMMERDSYSFNIKYELTINDDEIGIFVVNFKWEE